MVFVLTTQIKLMIDGYWHGGRIERGQCMLAHREWINSQASPHFCSLHNCIPACGWTKLHYVYILYLFSFHLSSDGH